MVGYDFELFCLCDELACNFVIETKSDLINIVEEVNPQFNIMLIVVS